MICGAYAVEIGTVNFINPRAAIEMSEGIEKYCEQAGITEIKKITGSYQI